MTRPERQQGWHRDSDPLRDMEARINSLAARVDLTDQQVRTDLYLLKQDVRDLRTRLGIEFVTRLEFDPVKKLVFGAVSLILVAVVSAVVATVLTR